MPVSLRDRLAALQHPVSAAEALGVEQVASNLDEASNVRIEAYLNSHDP